MPCAMSSSKPNRHATRTSPSRTNPMTTFIVMVSRRLAFVVSSNTSLFASATSGPLLPARPPAPYVPGRLPARSPIVGLATHPAPPTDGRLRDRAAAAPRKPCRPDDSRVGTASSGLENVRMSCAKLRLLAGGRPADHESGSPPPRRQYREGNVFYPFGVPPADLKRRKGQGDEPAEWRHGGWVAFAERIGQLERLRRNPEEWSPEFEPNSDGRPGPASRDETQPRGDQP